MAPMTNTQVAAHVRKMLAQVANKGGCLGYKDGTTIQFPPGLGFGVRAIRTGVNIEIADHGWVYQLTGGDPERIGDYQQQMDEIRAEVDKLRSVYTPALAGTTKWGVIILGASMSSVEDWTSI